MPPRFVIRQATSPSRAVTGMPFAEKLYAFSVYATVFDGRFCAGLMCCSCIVQVAKNFTILLTRSVSASSGPSGVAGVVL
jgi:hypothetical protein